MIKLKILLRQIRLNRGLTLEQMEDLTDVPKTTLNSIENEKVSPKFETLEKIAEGLKVKIKDIIESEYL